MPREKGAALWITIEGNWIRDSLSEALTELQTRPTALQGPYRFFGFGEAAVNNPKTLDVGHHTVPAPAQERIANEAS